MSDGLLPSEILGSEIRQGIIRPGDKEYFVWDTTGGLTNELREANIYGQLGNTYRMHNAKVPEEPTIPTLDVVLSKLGVKADNDPTGIKAARKFVDEFAKKQGVWKKKVERDPDFGKRGWETVKDLFKQTSNDLMNYEIAEGHRKIASGEDDGGLDWLGTKVANIMFPRAVQAVAEGRDPTAGEWGRDAVSNALYAVPFGGVARAAVPASRVLQYGSQAAAPAIVAAMDYAGDPNYTLTDAALNTAMGTGANLGVNKWIAPKLGQLIGTARGGISRRIPQFLKSALEDNPTNRDMAQATVAEATQILKAPNKSAGDIASDIASGVTKGYTPEEKASAQAVKDIYDASLKKVSGGIRPSDLLKASAETTGNPELSQKDVAGIAGNIAAGLNNPVPGFKIVQGSDGVRRPVIDASKEALDAWQAKVDSDTKKYAEVLAKKPELLSLFHNQSLKVPFTPTNMLKTYWVNQLGSSDPAIATGAIRELTAGNLDIGKVVKSVEDERAKEDAQSAVAQILSATPELTDEDRKYLNMVKEKPELLKFSQDDGLKQWLLSRGHSILQGTPAHRPLWEVR